MQAFVQNYDFSRQHVGACQGESFPECVPTGCECGSHWDELPGGELCSWNRAAARALCPRAGPSLPLRCPVASSLWACREPLGQLRVILPFPAVRPPVEGTEALMRSALEGSDF